MKEEVKYVYQEGPLLVAEKKGSSVYQETTVSSNRGRTAQFYEQYCTAHLCSRLRLVLSVLALATCVTVIIVLLINGIQSANREAAQAKEIVDLQDKLDAQQVRLHRMQKELQFLVNRQRAEEAKEGMERRLQMPLGVASDSRSFWDGEDEEVVDVDQLPVASPNKRLRLGKRLEDLSLRN